jgi:hypothetical protein
MRERERARRREADCDAANGASDCISHHILHATSLSSHATALLALPANRDDAAHRLIVSLSPRYLASERCECCLRDKHGAGPYRSHGQQRQSCARVDELPHRRRHVSWSYLLPVRRAYVPPILLIVPNMKRDMSGRDSIVFRCHFHPHGTGATPSHLCR